MIFRLTRKLATRLRIEPVPSLPPGESPLHDWTANLFMAERFQYIILTNSATLYSSVIPARGNTSPTSFNGNALAGIGECLRLDGLEALIDPLMAAALESPAFCRASDRRVLGSMNDFVLMAGYSIVDGYHSLAEVSRFLNQSPMKVIKYGRPLDEMRRLLSDGTQDSGCPGRPVHRDPLRNACGCMTPISWVEGVMVAGDTIEKPPAEAALEPEAPVKAAVSGKGVRRTRSKVYQFKITLKGTKPPIWRRIQISSKATFWDLHCAIQDSMGWYDGHLHEFRIPIPGLGREIPVGIPYEEEFTRKRTIPGWKLPIRDVFREPGVKIDYVYDFGDDWLHVVELEKILPAGEGVTYLRCLAGRRRCPPEDCGGVWMFAEILEIMADPSHPEHAERMAWLGGPFDPAEFSVDDVYFGDPKPRLEYKLDELELN